MPKKRWTCRSPFRLFSLASSPAHHHPHYLILLFFLLFVCSVASRAFRARAEAKRKGGIGLKKRKKKRGRGQKKSKRIKARCDCFFIRPELPKMGTSMIVAFFELTFDTPVRDVSRRSRGERRGARKGGRETYVCRRKERGIFFSRTHDHSNLTLS